MENQFENMDWADKVLEQSKIVETETKLDYIFLTSPIALVEKGKIITLRGLTKRKRETFENTLVSYELWHEGIKKWIPFGRKETEVIELISLSEEAFREFNSKL